MEDMSAASTTINQEKKRFELDINGEVARIEYILNEKGIMFLTHTEVPRSLEGQGIGKKIVEETLQYMKAHNLQLAPLCPFVAAYLKRHDEYRALLAPGYHV